MGKDGLGRDALAPDRDGLEGMDELGRDGMG